MQLTPPSSVAQLWTLFRCRGSLGISGPGVNLLCGCLSSRHGGRGSWGGCFRPVHPNTRWNYLTWWDPGDSGLRLFPQVLPRAFQGRQEWQLSPLGVLKHVWGFCRDLHHHTSQGLSTGEGWGGEDRALGHLDLFRPSPTSRTFIWSQGNTEEKLALSYSILPNVLLMAWVSPRIEFPTLLCYTSPEPSRAGDMHGTAMKTDNSKNPRFQQDGDAHGLSAHVVHCHTLNPRPGQAQNGSHRKELKTSTSHWRIAHTITPPGVEHNPLLVCQPRFLLLRSPPQDEHVLSKRHCPYLYQGGRLSTHKDCR